jgi:hypothetical protein
MGGPYLFPLPLTFISFNTPLRKCATHLQGVFLLA